MVRFGAFIVRERIRIQRGFGFIGLFYTAVGLLTFLKVWADVFTAYNIPPTALYVSVPIFMFFFAWSLGYLDERGQLWKHELEQYNMMNPQFTQIVEDMGILKKELEFVRSELKNLELIRDELKELKELKGDEIDGKDH